MPRLRIMVPRMPGLVARATEVRTNRADPIRMTVRRIGIRRRSCTRSTRCYAVFHRRGTPHTLCLPRLVGNPTNRTHRLGTARPP
jgi:hypothetical protein